MLVWIKKVVMICIWHFYVVVFSPECHYLKCHLATALFYAKLATRPNVSLSYHSSYICHRDAKMSAVAIATKLYQMVRLKTFLWLSVVLRDSCPNLSRVLKFLSSTRSCPGPQSNIWWIVQTSKQIWIAPGRAPTLDPFSTEEQTPEKIFTKGSNEIVLFE